MAVLDQLKNVFKKKTVDSDLNSGLSLGMPGESMFGDVSELAPHMTQRGVSVDANLSSSAAARVTEHQSTDQVDLPVLGRKTVAQHQRVLSVLLGASLITLVVVALLGLNKSNHVAQQLGATGQALMQSQRLAKSVSLALVGDANAFSAVQESAMILTRSVRGLSAGNDQLGLDSLDASYQPVLDKVVPMVDRAENSAATLMAQQKILIQTGAALRLIHRQSADLSDIAETVVSLKLQQAAPASEIAAAGQMLMLTQRIGKSANEFLTTDGVSPDTAVLLGKDLKLFKEISQGLLVGSATLRLAPSNDAQTHGQLVSLSKLFELTRAQAEVILSNLQAWVAARGAQVSILKDSEGLRQELETLQNLLSSHSGWSGLYLTVLVVDALVAVLSAAGLSSIQLQVSRQRQAGADQQRESAQRREQEAKRVNDANQAAILRLMNELQTLAEGDLTQQATVTEDITGAIADSVNYTVEELRILVGNVQSTASKVASTTAEVDVTSTELLAASNEQLYEIRETGRSVMDMAQRINTVSAQAQESADVARQSLKAAEVGFQAVQNAIGGMNAIRDQIQDTSKRIKRLGESSQEIGEITELISDITEQTNVLALNAAIQAASAGDAGRGFSVVAEEVQRLAERSADATRQIAALVKAIQTDTQDAVGAMERSTQGVVEGAKLSDNAGAALAEIDQVSRRLAELIAQISDSTLHEASMASEVADNIQHIFAVTEQTGEGTRSTATQVRELSKVAEELRQSVARFRIV